MNESRSGLNEIICLVRSSKEVVKNKPVISMLAVCLKRKREAVGGEGCRFKSTVMGKKATFPVFSSFFLIPLSRFRVRNNRKIFLNVPPDCRTLLSMFSVHLGF